MTQDLDAHKLARKRVATILDRTSPESFARTREERVLQYKGLLADLKPLTDADYTRLLIKVIESAFREFREDELFELIDQFRIFTRAHRSLPMEHRKKITLLAGSYFDLNRTGTPYRHYDPPGYMYQYSPFSIIPHNDGSELDRKRIFMLTWW